MAKICLCLTGKTLTQNLEILDAHRKFIDIAELRVDCLAPDERFLIRHFPEMAGIPVILSIKRVIDGGFFTGGEGSRITLFAKGLAYADANKRKNFAYLDLEEDLHVPSLEEAARTYGTRIIRSWHNLEGVDENLVDRIKKFKRVGDELVKASLTPRSLNDIARIYQTAKETSHMEKIFLCMGKYGDHTAILSELLGSRLCYVHPCNAREISGNNFCLDPQDLVQNYRFREINKDTKIFAVSGNPLSNDDIPRFYNSVFSMEQINAVSVPVPADSAHSLMRLADETGISGISINSPYNEEILSYLSHVSAEVHAIGTCNTVVQSPQGWMGYNTDAAGFTDSFLEFYGRNDLRWQRITIIGAGRVARAITAEVHRLKGKALILNRNPARARRLAEHYKYAWAGLDSRGVELMERYSDIIIQASSAGTHPDSDIDPAEFYEFTGRETVMDVNYKPEKTKFLKRAEEAGCRILNGYDMIYRQTRYQYIHFMNKEFPQSLISRVKF